MRTREIKFVILCNKLGGKRLDVLMRFLSSISFLAFMWSLLIAVAIAKHPDITKNFILAVFIVAMLHFAITEGLLKHTLTHFLPKRQGPYVAYPDKVKPIGKRFSDSSFPSSHMATTAAMLFVIVSFYPSLLLPAFLLGVLMAFSRLHNGMHYPTDILVGVGLGVGYGFASMVLLRIFI